ncbi:hypothetical protein SAMN04488134_11322 [Amphibacillus marinus]|uniref:Phosphoesterase n=1 Tax=Amphibacillus marinus TaxID=872970 RepID=A0A1H8SL65_9BACI|nr:metallophosphoesterase [Amphibacillus marinus]SEO79266.1 hypothetical protein SAMN04488134_11322 [Amphibacillus marinus]
MPRVLIISDSHGLTKEVRALKDHYQDQVEQLIHCGDSELDYQDDAMKGYHRVAGNCDYDAEYPEEASFTVAGVNFFVAHGHMDNVKMSLTPITYRASERDANIICHGHSHLAAATKVGDQLVINPGSIRLPRGRREETYAILDWDEDGLYHVHFYQLNGNEVTDLAMTTRLD